MPVGFLKVIMPANKRKYYRVPLKADALPPAKMTFYKPFFREPFDVTIADLSAGGMRVFSSEIFPLYFDFGLEFQVSNAQVIQATGKAVHQLKTDDGYDVGVIFTDLTENDRSVLKSLEKDFQSCEERIWREDKDICRKDCNFLPLCHKPQKAY